MAAALTLSHGPVQLPAFPRAVLLSSGMAKVWNERLPALRTSTCPKGCRNLVLRLFNDLFQRMANRTQRHSEALGDLTQFQALTAKLPNLVVPSNPLVTRSGADGAVGSEEFRQPLSLALTRKANERLKFQKVLRPIQHDSPSSLSGREQSLLHPITQPQHSKAPGSFVNDGLVGIRHGHGANHHTERSVYHGPVEVAGPLSVVEPPQIRSFCCSGKHITDYTR